MAVSPTGSSLQAARAYQANASGPESSLPGMQVLRQRNTRVRETPPEVDRLPSAPAGGTRSLAINTDKGTVVDVVG